MGGIWEKLVKFGEKALNKLVFLWLLGLVINNTHLWKYGAFSLHLLDTSNLTSGIPFLFLIITPCVLIYKLKIAINYEDWGGDKKNLIKYLYMILIALPSVIVSIIDVATSMILVLLNVGVITGYLYNHDVHYWNSSTLLDIFDSIRANIRPARRFLIVTFCFVLAFLYGYTVHGRVPKIYGGGMHNKVYFSSTPFIRQFLNPGQIYDLIDETENSFLLYDPQTREVLEIPKKIEDSTAFHYLKAVAPPPVFKVDMDEYPCPVDTIPESLGGSLRMFFAADIHATNFKPDKYPDHFQRLRILSGLWNNDTTAARYILGDLLESPPQNRRYGTDLDSLRTILNGFRKKPYFILGNNDCRNGRQQAMLLDGLQDHGFTYGHRQPPIWLQYFERMSTVVIGYYLPKTKPAFGSDPWFDPGFSYQKAMLKYLLKKTKNFPGIKLIVLLTHQGFIEANPWSGQYELSRELDFDEMKTWSAFVDSVKRQLWKYDKDSPEYQPDITDPGRQTDVIVISGHFHNGLLIRKLDGIDHIVCPSFTLATRDSSYYRKGNLLRLTYDLNNKIRIRFENINNNKSDTTEIIL